MKEVIKKAVADALKDIWNITDVDFSIEHPADVSHGDYACNVAMVIAKEVEEAPRTVAEKLVSVLDGQIEYVDRLEIAGPGFINFYLSRDFFVSEVMRAVESEERWGSNNSEVEEMVMVEYTSPNLFKSIHVGNLVGNIIGEAVSRLFELSGAEVKRINYPSDIGLPAAKAVWGLRKTGGDLNDISVLSKAYILGNEAYESNESEKVEIDNINKALYEKSDQELNKIYSAGVETSKRHMTELCQILGTKFDLEITESQSSPIGKKIVKDNIGKVFALSEGAVVYQGEKVGLHTRVFLNSKDLPTYEAKDVGNFTLKQEAYPEWSKSVMVTGSEQREYFKVLFSALTELYPELKDKTLEHVPTGFLTLTTGKMSSRKGNVLLADELLSEIRQEAKQKAENSRTDNIYELTEKVAVAALKYQILRQGPGTDIVFDKEKSLSFEGDSGPYLQYTHARIVSVIEKVEQLGLSGGVKVVPETPYEIERLVYQFPEVIETALKERAPHKVVGYLTELSGAFNSFYSQEKIADQTDENAPYKIMLTKAVRITLKNGLWVLGIQAPERM